MRFGRVEGVVDVTEEQGRRCLHLVVTLETGTRLEVIRDEVLAPLAPIDNERDLIWHADQWTQETIGVDLAELGWEPIGADELPSPTPGELARSARYAVRHLA